MNLTAEQLELRASGMPMAFLCSGSARRPSLSIYESSDPARLGSAAHEALRSVAEGIGVPWDAIPEIAERHGVNADELRFLVATGAKLWATVSESFRDALTEVPLSVEVAPGVRLFGHADLLSVSGTVARCGDWKTGRKDSDYSHQMRAYGALVLLDNPTLTEVTITILWVRSGEIENYTMTRADAKTWVGRLRAEVIEWRGEYRPGSHCLYCRRSHECSAANALSRRDVAAILDTEAAPDIARMAPGQLIELHRKATVVAKYAERVRDAIRTHVDTNGDVESGDVVLTIDVEKRRGLDPLTAWPVLDAAGFGDDDLAACVDIRVSKVEKRVAEKAGRGKGAAAVRAIGASLDAAGAVRTTEVKKLVQKRKAG